MSVVKKTAFCKMRSHSATCGMSQPVSQIVRESRQLIETANAVFKTKVFFATEPIQVPVFFSIFPNSSFQIQQLAQTLRVSRMMLMLPGVLLALRNFYRVA